MIQNIFEVVDQEVSSNTILKLFPISDGFHLTMVVVWWSLGSPLTLNISS